MVHQSPCSVSSENRQQSLKNGIPNLTNAIALRKLKQHLDRLWLLSILAKVRAASARPRQPPLFLKPCVVERLRDWWVRANWHDDTVAGRFREFEDGRRRIEPEKPLESALELFGAVFDIVRRSFVEILRDGRPLRPHELQQADQKQILLWRPRSVRDVRREIKGPALAALARCPAGHQPFDLRPVPIAKALNKLPKSGVLIGAERMLLAARTGRDQGGLVHL
jgi:hypothetical protein